MKNSDKIPASLVSKLISYDPESGNLFWKERGIDCLPDWKYPCDKKVEMFNKLHAGNQAFISGSLTGHKLGYIYGIRFGAHRVAWAIHYGKWPDGEIDHINGDTSDNRICNLRDVSHHENMMNKRTTKRNKSGINGVSWIKDRKKWYASIRYNGKTISLGKYDDKFEAARARKAAELKLGFHSNHGRSL